MTAALDLAAPAHGAGVRGRLARQLTRALVAAGARVRLHPLHDDPPPPGPPRRDPDLEALSAPVDARVALHLAMPHEVRPVAGKRTVCWTMFDADRVPAAWAAAARRHDLTLVPTESSRQAWLRGGAPEERVRVAPLGVDADFFAAPAAPAALALPSGRPLAAVRTRVLVACEARPRCNLPGVVRAWIHATTAADDAVLVVAVAPVTAASDAQLRADLAAALVRLAKPPAAAAPIVFVAAPPDEAELRALYRGGTHLLSLSRGEGWDLCALEAAAAGLPLALPRHSMYADVFADDEAAWIDAAPTHAVLDGTMAHDEEIFYRGARWWHPDEAQAAALLRGVIDGTRAVPPPPASAAARHDWPSAVRRVLALLDG
jgi:glycosyltransferase involved in cell wall biosynthesis